MSAGFICANVLTLRHTASSLHTSFLCPPRQTLGTPCRVKVGRPNSLNMSASGENDLEKVLSSVTDESATLRFQCPKCGSLLPEAQVPVGTTFTESCANCSAKFPKRNGYVDLTPNPNQFVIPSPFTASRQAMFETPILAYLYERGWRDNFEKSGYPGPEMEADLALDFLVPAKTVLDLSCGSGILTRRLAAANVIDRVVGTDISHPMLAEATSRVRDDIRLSDLDFVRADVSKLPFADGSFDGVNAAAAIHCWPCIQDGLREVRRILTPGGKFFATTFYIGAYVPDRVPEQFVPLARSLYQVFQAGGSMHFFEEDELLYLVKAAGFASVDIEKRKRCAIIRCVKGDN